jgi:uncharacterized protein YqgV (UPF0045/DUF77 family)
MPQGLDERVTVAEVTIEPDEVREDAVEAMRDPELTVEVGPSSTTVEGRFDAIVHAVQRGHRSAAASVDRVTTTVRIETGPAG